MPDCYDAYYDTARFDYSSFDTLCEGVGLPKSITATITERIDTGSSFSEWIDVGSSITE